MSTLTNTPIRTKKSFIRSISVRRIRLMILVVTAVIILIPVAVIGPYALRVQHFGANPDGGYHADFYLYVSPTAKRMARAGEQVTILVQPNNSGTKSDDPGVHRKDAWWTGFERQKIPGARFHPPWRRPGFLHSCTGPGLAYYGTNRPSANRFAIDRDA